MIDTVSRPEVILIVDDEDMVLTSIDSFLSSETEYEVVTRNPEQALEYVEGTTSTSSSPTI